MELAERLAEERRARLAAERLLELKQAELFAANRKLNKHARALSHQIHETRAEITEVKSENKLVKSQLGLAHQKIELVEGQLWKALQTMRDGFAMFNADGLLELANPAYLDVFEQLDTIGPGASYHHVLDMLVEEGIVDLQGEDGRDWRIRMLARWDHDPIPSETMRLWTGQFIKIQDRRMPDGGVVSLCFDITELMRMWSAVEELPDGFVIYDAEDRLLMCNEPYRQIYDLSAPAIVPGACFEDILRYGLEHGQYSAAEGREEAWLEERLAAHRTAQQELEQQLPDGRWLRVYERALSDGGRVGLRIDITDVKQTQKDLEEARQKAETASRAKSSFLANMSHEIRTPMNGVVGMADLLMESSLSDEQRLYVETIRGSGEALLVIINDILDYSKLEADKMTLKPEPFDLERVVHEVLLLLQPTARDKAIELLIDYDMFLPTGFVGDPGRIRQILTNIIGNAVKFTTEGHVLVRVTGKVETDGRAAIHMSIEDTGIGIAPEKVDHIFGEFNQVDDERNRAFEGTGLGLAITQRLVAMMGGDIWVESELGKGSCFGIRVELPTSDAGESSSLANLAGFHSAAVIDGQTVTRTITSRQLQSVGLTITCFASAEDVLSAGPDLPDILVAERDLPGMDAVDLSRQLASNGRKQPMVILSGRPDPLSPEAEECGVVAMLQKPPTRSSLFAAIETAARQATRTSVDTTELRDSAPPVMSFRHRDPSELAIKEPPPKSDARQPGEPAASDAGSMPLDVLVAEDNKTNQLVFRKMAMKLDVPMELRFANNGIEAVAAFQERAPDLIFMDISMPRMDGKEATREIRAFEAEGARVPIIAVTAHAMAGDRDGILDAGLDDYLTKPLRKQELAALIDKWTVGRVQAAAE